MSPLGNKEGSEEMSNFGNWMNDPEQTQRAAAGKDKKLKSAFLELSEDHATIQGSGADPYHVTLDSCTCSDFVHRHQPCKHIFAFADQLGLLADFPEYKKGKTGFDKDLETEKYKKLFLDGRMKAEDYVKLCKILEKL